MSQILLQPANAMITLENNRENESFCVALLVRGNRQPFAVLIIWKNINRDESW